jgi:hypothetical protein
MGLAIALPVGMVALTGVGSASGLAHGTENGTGIVVCNIDGKVTFKPPLHSSGPVDTESDKATYKMQACSGGTPDPGSSKTDETEPFLSLEFNTCADLFNEDGPTAIEASWTGNALNPSISRYFSSAITTNEGSVFFEAPPKLAMGGVTTGSFADPTSSYLTLTFDQNLTTINTACASKKGLKSLTFKFAGVGGQWQS